MKQDLCIIIPYSNSVNMLERLQRQMNFDIIKDYYEHSDYSVYTVFVIGIDFLHIDLSWLINIGMRMASDGDYKYAVKIDADILFDYELFNSIIRYMDRNKLDIYCPHDNIIDLPENGLQKHILGYDLDATLRYQQDCKWICGGIQFMRVKTFFETGGFNEDFIGWGGEDVEFWIRAERAGLKCGKPPEHKFYGNPYHLWHDRNPNKLEGQPHYANNLAMCNKLYAMNDNEFKTYLEELKQRDIGNPDKYKGVYL